MRAEPNRRRRSDWRASRGQRRPKPTRLRQFAKPSKNSSLSSEISDCRFQIADSIQQQALLCNLNSEFCNSPSRLSRAGLQNQRLQAFPPTRQYQRAVIDLLSPPIPVRTLAFDDEG